MENTNYVDLVLRNDEPDLFSGVYISDRSNINKFLPISGRMPCWIKFSFDSTNPIPNKNVPCLCGNPKHWVVKFEE